MSDDTPTERPDPDRPGPERPGPERPAPGAGGDAGGDQPADTPTERFAADDGAAYEDTPTEGFDAARSARTPGDNAPTERFVPITGPSAPLDAPTMRLPTAGLPPLSPPTQFLPPVQPPAGTADASRPSRGLLYTLIALGAALLIAVVVLLLTLFGNNGTDPVVAPTPTDSAAPSPSATESQAPSPTPTEKPSTPPEPTVAPPPPGPTFDAFDAPASAGCEEGQDDAPLTFVWSSSNAVRAYIGVQTTDAAEDPHESDLPPDYTYNGLEFDCDDESQVYTVTLENDEGDRVSESRTITR